LLELRGASVVGFSPLRDENLPPQSDVVYFGCGHPERYAAALSENHCMFAALRSHLCAGRRVYGEGGGAAYLCREMETPAGEFRRMAGILPATARLFRRPAGAEPVEVRLARPAWLGLTGMQLRGYRNPHWQLDPLDDSYLLLAEPDYRCDLLGDSQSVGSLIHLDFAADADFLDRFFCPERAAISSTGSRTAGFAL
jgi:cobyrinic acid a,c-diamide synthase